MANKATKPKKTLEDVKKQCEECGGDIGLGEDALALERVVIGPRFPIAVGDTQFFHVSGCIEGYFCKGQGERLPRRIP